MNIGTLYLIVWWLVGGLAVLGLLESSPSYDWGASTYLALLPCEARSDMTQLTLRVNTTCGVE